MHYRKILCIPRVRRRAVLNRRMPSTWQREAEFEFGPNSYAHWDGEAGANSSKASDDINKEADGAGKECDSFSYASGSSKGRRRGGRFTPFFVRKLQRGEFGTPGTEIAPKHASSASVTGETKKIPSTKIDENPEQSPSDDNKTEELIVNLDPVIGDTDYSTTEDVEIIDQVTKFSPAVQESFRKFDDSIRQLEERFQEKERIEIAKEIPVHLSEGDIVEESLQEKLNELDPYDGKSKDSVLERRIADLAARTQNLTEGELLRRTSLLKNHKSRVSERETDADDESEERVGSTCARQSRRVAAVLSLLYASHAGESNGPLYTVCSPCPTSTDSREPIAIGEEFSMADVSSSDPRCFRFRTVPYTECYEP